MKKIFVFIVLLFTIFFVSGCSSNSNVEPGKSKILVVYFSCTNNTEEIASKIVDVLNCDKFEITPKNPYTSDDLNYNNSSCRANLEQNDDFSRPEINNVLSNVDEYSTIFIGFPIWWGKMPKIMYTFFETYNFDNKTLVPFCTSGGSGISTSVSEVKNLEKMLRF